jgi:hypothetical protein
LHALGKPATEKEIARESFTSRNGTENWYLSRALRQRGIRVRFSLEPIGAQPLPFPSIAGVRLPNFANAGHFITILGRVDDQYNQYIIGDPLEGRLVLSQSLMRTNYTFTGFFMRPE